MNVLSYKTIWKGVMDALDRQQKRSGYVISGMTPSATGSGSLGVTVASGVYVKNNATTSTVYAGGTVTLTASDTNNARVDIVFMSSGGTLTATAGTPAAVVVGVSGPVPPAWPSACCPLAICLVPPTATDFTTGGYVEDVTQTNQLAATASPLTTKGDVWGYSSVDARIPVGTNNQILTADSAQTLGLKWGEGPLTTDGDLLIGATAGTASRLAVGAAGRLLSGGTTPAWGQGPLTTDGDLLIGATAGTPTRLAVGATAGMYPRSSGSAIAWSLGPLTTTGDLLLGSTGAEPTRLAIGSNGTHLVSNGTTASWAAQSSGGFVQLAQSIVTGSVAASIDFTSISGAYSGLMVLAQAARDSAGDWDYMQVRMNNDSAGNYYESLIVNVNATVTGTSPVTQTSAKCGATEGTGGLSGGADISVIWIPNYAGTTWKKQFTYDAGIRISSAAGGQGVIKGTGNWDSSAAISRLTFFPLTGNFKIGTAITLYGMQ